MLRVVYAECRKQTHYAECRYAANLYVECHSAVFQYRHCIEYHLYSESGYFKIDHFWEEVPNQSLWPYSQKLH
jgi:hypothetical protein